MKSEISTTELRRQLLKILPEYMIPNYFIKVPKIPISPNGKADRKKLLELSEVNTFETATTVIRDEKQKEIFEIWKRILNSDNFGIHDSFFEVGGTSMRLMEMQAEINNVYQNKISVTDLFTYTTIADIAALLTDEGKTSATNINYTLVNLPKEFFCQSGAIDGSSVFNFQMKGQILRKLKKIAQIENCDIYDIFLSVYGYLFYDVSKQSKLAIHVLNSSCEMFFIELDFDEIDEFSNLFDIVKRNRKDTDKKNIFSVEIAKNVQVEKSQTKVLPLFYKDQATIDTDLMSKYDISFGVSKQDEIVQFTCEFNSKRILKSQIKFFIDRYIKCIETVIDLYKLD